MHITLIKIVASIVLLGVGFVSISGTTQNNSLFDENITYKVNSPRDVSGQDIRVLGCPDLAVYSNIAISISFNCNNPFPTSLGSGWNPYIDLDGDGNPELLNHAASFSRYLDPCCVDPCSWECDHCMCDPCCGDPCCDDPCCNDPCMCDPCCWDPDCFGYRNQDDHVPGAGLYDLETNTFENQEAAIAWAYKQAIANGTIDKNALVNSERARADKNALVNNERARANGDDCYDEAGIITLGSYAGEEIGSVDTFQILNLDPSVMSYDGFSAEGELTINLIAIFDVTKDGLPDAIVRLNSITTGTIYYYYVENISLPPGVSCVSDTNNDGLVGVEDLLATIAAWGPCE
jgi:hypothetical protein